MFNRKPKENKETFNTVNLIVGMARQMKLNPIKLVKSAIDFNANTKFINQMNEQIDKEINKTKSSK
jgi:hypothetical protein